MPSSRIHYFDWLRATAVLGVVAYHALLPYTDGWMVNNGEQSELLTAAVLLFETFGLGLLFLIAGGSVRFALRTRTPRAFVRERAARLLAPFVVGTLLISPMIWYISDVHAGRTSASYLAYLPTWPAIVASWASEFGFSPKILQVGVHLWFLAYLFAFSVIGVPVFAFLESSRGRALVDALGRAARWPGATLLFALPITLPPFILFAGSETDNDWWTFGWYAAIFLVGYLLYADGRLVAAVRRDLLPALVVGVASLVGLLGLGFETWAETRESNAFSYDATYAVMVGLYGLTGWAFTLVLLNLGMRAGFMQRPLPRRAGEAVLPTYVVHLPLVLAISFLIVEWPMGLAAKAVLNVVLGVGVTVVVATAALRLPVVRVLLGVRPPRPVTTSVPALRASSRTAES